MKRVLLLSVLLLLFPLTVNALENEKVGPREAWLQSYESNRIGWTFDDNDVGYMDFTISLKYPFLSSDSAIAAKEDAAGKKGYENFRTRYLRSVPYFSFTGRFGQYLGTRVSSPVIGKRFNPKLFLRFFTSHPDDSYLDFGYGHESNGQRINSQNAYQDLRDDFSREGEDPEFANDYISRGWDYWELNWFRKFGLTGDDAGKSLQNQNYEEARRSLSAFVSLKYFMEDGYLQGEAEEYNLWENVGEAKARKEFDGVTIKLAYQTQKYFFELEKLTLSLFGGLSIIYTTGYKNLFSNNTLRIESIVRVGSVPLLVWWSEGYNSDLVDYYKRVRSGGVGLDLQTYWTK